MATRNPLRNDQSLYNLMVELKKHLKICRECRAARKCNDPHLMCGYGMMLIVGCAEKFDGMIELRREALKGPSHTIFACPDLSKHGKSYSLIATPYHATAIQDRLF